MNFSASRHLEGNASSLTPRTGAQKNTTSTTPQHHIASGRIYTAVQIVTAVLMITSAWAFASFLCYGLRRRAWRRRKNKTTATLMSLAVCAPVFTLLRLTFTQVLIAVAKLNATTTAHGELLCTVVSVVHNTAYMLSVLPIYVFLWYRQRTLYSKPSLRHLNTRAVNGVSIAVLPLMVAGLLAVNIMFFFIEHHITAEEGYTFRLNAKLGSAPVYALMATTFSVQVTLFLLFLYPLRNYAGGNSGGGSEVRRAKTGKRLKSLIRLASLSITACVASDFVAMCATKALQSGMGTNTMLSIMIYDVNLLVNVVSIMFSFENYRQIATGSFHWALSAVGCCGGLRNEYELSYLSGSSRRHQHRNGGGGAGNGGGVSQAATGAHSSTNI